MAAMRQSRSQSRPQAWSGWATRWIPVVLVLALLASGFAAYQYDLGDRWFGGTTTPPSPDPDTERAAVPPPAGVSLPLPTEPAPVAQGVAGEMAELFYRRLVGEPGTSVGMALHRARIDLLRKGNISGLVYTPFCSMDLRLESAP